MEKINVAELLKNCPKGMELDCTLYDNCTYEGIEDVGYINILVNTPSGRIKLTKEGCFIRHDKNAKCVIFPKGKNTWEGFVPPCKFKDGDIVATTNGRCIGITTGGNSESSIPTYCVIKISGEFEAYFGNKEKWMFRRFATEEEKGKLFQAIKNNGYRWNAETKTLEKLIEPKFKAGNKVKNKDNFIVTIVRLDGDYYDYVNEDGQCGVIYIRSQNEWELVPNKFDVNTLKPFEKVLVKYGNITCWKAEIYSHYDEEMSNSPFCCIGAWYEKCIPYEGNEYLLGTDDDCEEFYKTWK